jgi:hypothetical protein
VHSTEERKIYSVVTAMDKLIRPKCKVVAKVAAAKTFTSQDHYKNATIPFLQLPDDGILGV